MSRPMNPTIFRIVGIAMILIALFNVAPSLSLFAGPPDATQPETQPRTDPDAVGVDDTSAEERAIQSTGGITTPMGVMTLIHAPVMIAVGIALLLMKRWEMFAAIVLVIDALVRVGTLLSNLVAPDAGLGTLLLPIVLLIVDLALAYVMWQQWNARRQEQSHRSGERLGAA